MTDPIIRFDQAVKRFGDLTVLDELDFEVMPGESHAPCVGDDWAAR